jgi:cell division protease FtsH
MSEKIGLVSVLPRPEDEGSYFPGAGSASEATRELVDQEVRRIVDECYETAVTKLRENRDRLEALTQALLEHETLDELDAYRAAGFERPPVDPDSAAKAGALSARDASDESPG